MPTAPVVPVAKIQAKLEKPKPVRPHDSPLPPSSVDLALPEESLSDIAPSPDTAPLVEVIAHQIETPSTASSETHYVTLRSTTEPTTDRLLEKAQDFLKTNEFPAALALYDTILKDDPNNRAALQGKGYVLQRTGHYEEAVETARRLLQLDPHDKAARTHLVTALGQSPSPESKTELQQISDSLPDFAPAHRALAHSLESQDKMPEALEQMDHAARLEPHNLFYRLDLAILYDKTGHEAEALTLYRQILRATADQDEQDRLPLSLSSLRARADYLASR